MFLPRITLGRVAPSAVPVGQQQEGASQLRDGRESANTAHARDPKGFAYLKRDLVRLLGILAADRPSVQDRVRACGGIPVVLNLCVIDDRNPCEYAIPFPSRVKPSPALTARGGFLPRCAFPASIETSLIERMN